jgi:uncharacterized membrane protein
VKSPGFVNYALGRIHLRRSSEKIIVSDVENNPKATRKEGMLCYLGGVFFPIVYLSLEPYKSDGFIRFHSFQSIAFTLAWSALTITNDRVRFQLRGVNTALSIAWLFLFVTWIALMFKAYRGRRMKLPVVGNLAERWAGQGQ